MRHLSSLGAAIGTLLVCYATGRLLLARLQLALTRAEERALSLLCGSAIVSFLVLAVGRAGWLNRTVLLGLALTAAVLGSRAKLAPTVAAIPLPSPWRVAGGALFAIYGLSYAAVALAPEISPDGMAYHLPLIQHYWRVGAIVPIPTDLYAQLSQGLEMLFLPAYAFGGNPAAALVHLGLLFSLPVLMLAYGRRQGEAQPAAAAALLVFMAPVIGVDASAAYNDVALAATLFGLFFALRAWQNDGTPNWLLVAGLLAGFAFAIKYTAALALPLGLAAVLWPPGARMARAARFLAPAGLMILPWLLKNLAFTGNPVSPFFNTWFPNNILDWPLEQEYFRAVGNYVGYRSAWSIPWEVTILGEVLQGLMGPVLLLLPLGLIAWRQPESRRLCAAALVAALPFLLNHGTRFLIPALAFLALALARAMQPWPRVMAALVAVHAIASWPGIVQHYASPQAWRIKEIPWSAALGRETDEEFLLRKLPDFPLIQALNARTSPGEPVLAFRQYAASYLHADLLIDNRSRRTAELCRVLYVPVLEARHPTAGERFWFPKTALTGIRLRKAPGSILTATEVRLFDLMQPLRLPESPRVSADPARDDAGLSFDGNRLTRWRGGLNPGRPAHLEVRWQTPVALTRVDIEHRPIHPPPQLTLYGQYPDGEWRSLSSEAQPAIAGPIPQARAAATRELRRRGIRFVLLDDRDLIASDVQDHLADWNWRPVRKNRAMTLYELL